MNTHDLEILESTTTFDFTDPKTIEFLNQQLGI